MIKRNKIIIILFFLFFININYVLASSCFTVPFKQITIDGYFNDWADIPAAIQDREGDTSLISDWTHLYIANDNNFIYIRFKFSQDLGTNPFLDVNVRISCRDGNAYSLEGHLVSDITYNWTGIGDYFGSDILKKYPLSYIARGSKDIEYKIPISDIPCGISWAGISAWTEEDDSDYNMYVCYDKPNEQNETPLECANFDFSKHTLHIPCFSIGDSSYWLEFKIINDDPVQLELTDFGEY